MPVMINGVPGYFNPHRINRGSVPKDLNFYELEREAYQGEKVIMCKNIVLSNAIHYGTFITSKILPMYIGTGTINERDKVTFSDYEQKSLLTFEKVLKRENALYSALVNDGSYYHCCEVKWGYHHIRTEDEQAHGYVSFGVHVDPSEVPEYLHLIHIQDDEDAASFVTKESISSNFEEKIKHGMFIYDITFASRSIPFSIICQESDPDSLFDDQMMNLYVL
jgi:hypothetical protein